MLRIAKRFIYVNVERKLSTATINQLNSAWKILQVDILKKKWEELYLKRPRIEKKLPHILSHSEEQALIDAPTNIKHKTILKLAYSSGIRRGELLKRIISYVQGYYDPTQLKDLIETNELKMPDSFNDFVKLNFLAGFCNIFCLRGSTKSGIMAFLLLPT